jgi:outer membrane lipoprotein-sorting protein
MRRHVVLAIFFALAVAAVADPSSAPFLAELQASLAGATNVQSDFVQEKRLSILQQTVTLKGRLAVQQPGRIAWQVSEPIRYNLVLDGTTLRQWDETSGKLQRMSLAGNPVFGVVVAQLRGWFAGRFDALDKDFQVEGDAAAIPPALTFTPRETSFAHKAVRRVVLTFREDRRYLRDMLIEETSGDRTFMVFTNTVLNAALDPSVWEVMPHGR